MMFIVRRRQFALIIVGFALVIALLGAGAWRILDNERAELESSVARGIAQRDHLAIENSVLIEQREGLSRRVVILERSSQVKGQAYAKVDAQLEDLQRQILDLKEDVAFYREIVSEDVRSDRVRIQRLVLERDGSERDYRFRVVLTRSKQDNKVIDGSLLLSVDGDRDGKRVRLTLEQLVTFPVAKLQFSFKHFQRIEGRLHLPEWFVPKRVVIQVNAENSDAKPVRESFAWSVVNS